MLSRQQLVVLSGNLPVCRVQTYATGGVVVSCCSLFSWVFLPKAGDMRATVLVSEVSVGVGYRSSLKINMCTIYLFLFLVVVR